MKVLSKKDIRISTITESKQPGVFDTKEPGSIGYLGPQSYYTATTEDFSDAQIKELIQIVNDPERYGFTVEVANLLAAKLQRYLNEKRKRNE